MSSLVLPRRQIWTQQPQTHTAIAPEYSALAPRLIVNYGGSPNDLVSGKSPVAITRSYAADSKGLGLKGTSGVAQYASRLTGKYLTLVISVTLGVYAGAYQMLFETEVATAARTEGTLMVLPYYDSVAATSAWWTIVLCPSDGVNYTYGIVKFPAPSANIPHTLVVRIDRNLTGPAKVLSVHVDGIAQVLTPAGTNNTQGSNSNFNANNLYINQRAGGAIPGAHNVHFVGVFGSLFSAAKAELLSRNPWQIFAPRSTYLFSVTALANIISLGLVSAQFSAQAYQASADSALGTGSAGAGAYAVSPAGVLSTAVGTVPVTSQAAFVSAVQSLQGASVSLNSPDLDYILGALSNAVSLGLASISSTARAITYSTPGGTVHVVPYEFLGDYDIVHFSGSVAVDRAGALIIVLR